MKLTKEQAESMKAIIDSMVDKDKDWNLAIQEGYIHLDKSDTISHFFWKHDVRKCRDLILKDLKKLIGVQSHYYYNIINKRFGGLE